MIRNRRPLWTLCLQIEKSSLTESLVPTAPTTSSQCIPLNSGIDIDGYLVKVRLLLLLCREDEGIKKCVSLKALRTLDCMDVETALEIYRQEVKNSTPDEKVSTTLVPELEFKRWKKNGLSILSYPAGLTFSPKHSRLFITDQLLHSVFIIDMHCPANVTHRWWWAETH